MSNCWSEYSYIVNASLSVEVYSACSFYKQLNDAKVNSTMLRSIDCSDPNCRQMINSQKLTFDMKPECTLVDVATGKNILIKDIERICQGIVATVPPQKTALNSPSSSAPDNEIGIDRQFITTTSTPNVIVSNNSTTIIIIAVAITAVLLLMGFGYWIRSKNQRQSPLNDDIAMMGSKEDMEFDYSISTSSPSENYSKNDIDMGDLALYRIRRTDLRIISRISSDPTSETWKAEYMGEIVAVKRLAAKSSLQSLQQFIQEMNLLTTIQCPNIVQFIGTIWSHPRDIALVSEFMEGGDLRTLLNNKILMEWSHKLSCLYQIAEALGYLHIMDPKIIHRNVKSSNIMLQGDFVHAKLTDFRIARQVDDTTMTLGAGTFRWMAPEVLLDGYYTESADIFSFGVILAEIDSSILPYSDVRGGNGRQFTDAVLITKIMSGEIKPTINRSCPDWYRTLIYECMELIPSDRPTSLQVAYRIRSELKKII